MAHRITKNELRGSVDYLNKLTGNPTDPWQRDEDGEYLRNERGNLVYNPGTYTLDWCNGGVALCTMGGRDVLHRGSKRDLYGRLRALIQGVEIAQRMNGND